MKKILYSALSILLFSCEEVVDIDVKDGVEQLVVDAWIVNEAATQTVTLTLSQPYFDQTTQKPAIGAEVYLVREDSTVFKFIDENQTGKYTFTPESGKPFLTLGEQAALYVKYGGEEFYSVSTLNRVPTIDSLRYEKFTWPIEPEDGPKKGILAEFYANDFAGVGDTYLVRSWKNDTLRAKADEMMLAYDAAFSAGGSVDGILFVQPIRSSITTELFLDGDKLKVELFSIPNDAFYIISQIQTETNNGGIFATPSANIPSNIINVNTNSTTKALGLFMLTNVSRYTTIIDEDLAAEED